MKRDASWQSFPCDEWQMSRDQHGYGRQWFQGKLWKAHRVSWFLTHGPIPPGKRVLHRCDNPPCREPKHLFLGTQKDNVMDMSAKGRHGRSTLTNEQVGEIRKRRANKEKVHALAAEYGVAPGTISRIANGQRRIYV